jgi:hypothetical protein
MQADTLTVLLYRERRGELEALHRALGGVEDARVPGPGAAAAGGGGAPEGSGPLAATRSPPSRRGAPGPP